MEDILAEVVNGSDVASALAGLLEEETPTLAELRQGSRLAQAAVPLPANTQHGLQYENADSSTAGTSVAEGDQSQALTADTQQRAAVDPGQIEAQEEVSEAMSTDDEQSVMSRVAQQPEFQTFVEYVLESACFSLLQESAADKWQAP